LRASHSPLEYDSNQQILFPESKQEPSELQKILTKNDAMDIHTLFHILAKSILAYGGNLVKSP
jgi:hypothetical protein